MVTRNHGTSKCREPGGAGYCAIACMGSRGRGSITIYNLPTKTSIWLLKFNKTYVLHTPSPSPPWKGFDFESP
jgi:hypothetical protein